MRYRGLRLLVCVLLGLATLGAGQNRSEVPEVPVVPIPIVDGPATPPSEMEGTFGCGLVTSRGSAILAPSYPLEFQGRSFSIKRWHGRVSGTYQLRGNNVVLLFGDLVPLRWNLVYSKSAGGETLIEAAGFSGQRVRCYRTLKSNSPVL